MNKVDLNLYSKFVEGITAPAGNDADVLIERIRLLSKFTNPALLLSSSSGLAGESGEFSEIVKKIVFHGKELTPELHTHMAKELGDVIWYWVNACRALGVDPNSVIADNVAKLEARYPGGKFDVFHAENRKSGDI